MFDGHFFTGIANTIGRVMCGWVSDRPWADALLINNIALMIGGAATIASPFCVNYGMFATYAAVFGLGIGEFAFRIHFLERKEPFTTNEGESESEKFL